MGYTIYGKVDTLEEFEELAEKDKMKDAMIRASNKYDIKYSNLLNAYEKNGLMGVYNLGMEHMYDYLKE